MNTDPKAAPRLLRPSGIDSPVGALTPRTDPLVGQTIDGRYHVERSIGEGGMGVVYAGQHRVIGKKVAIKVLRGEMAKDEELTARFLQEARAASAIGNPHIVDISDFGRTPDGSTYFVMELLEGRSLGDVMKDARGPMPVPRLVNLAKQLAQGLAAAHAATIVHRDLKPDNIMLVTRGTERDFVKILDFGIAKVGGTTNKMTRAGSVFGTPHYMSPEQAAGAHVDHRTDIYALGAIVYEMAAGRVPFDADNMMGILTQHMYKAPVPLRALVPAVNVPPGLDAIVLKCLSKHPDGRYRTMDELVADLQRLEGGIAPGAVNDLMGRSSSFDATPGSTSGSMPHPVPASPAGAKARWPMFVVLGGVGTVILVVVVALVARGVGSAKAHPRSTAATATATAAVTATATSTAPTTAATTTTSVAAAPTTTASAVATTEVLLSVKPADATVTRDDQDLGGSPVALHLGSGESASVTVSHKGYKTKTVTVDASEPKVTIALEPTFGAGPAATKPAGGIDDVGDPFAKKH
jgi:tRNA A-37 threonylcarbamoyl transferase component Bud32